MKNNGVFLEYQIEYYNYINKLRGFEFLIDNENEVLAFNSKRNIIYHVPNKKHFDVEKNYYYVKTRKTEYGTIALSHYKHFHDLDEQFSEFPLFDEDNFLNLYSIPNDLGKDPLEASMEKIISFPILMDAIGEENRKFVKEHIYSNMGFNRK